MRPIAEEHKELFHYTTATGLSGIITSGTLWVTHYTFLNDHQEYRLFFDHRLPALLEIAITGAYERVKSHPYVSHAVRKRGGPSAYRSAMHRELLPVFRKWTSELNTPYIGCFCSAATPLIARHGLLSQWRGYGPDRGYVLVFDTKGLDGLMQKEAHRIKGMDFFIGDVEYYDDAAKDKGVLPETSDQTQEVSDAMTEFLVSNSPDDAP